MPTNQSQRDLIARMKLIPVQALIENKKLLLIDDSIVRGRSSVMNDRVLYRSGSKRSSRPPGMSSSCIRLQISELLQSKSEMELITRRVIREREGDNCPEEVLEEYTNPDTCRYAQMIEEIRRLQRILLRCGITGLMTSLRPSVWNHAGYVLTALTEKSDYNLTETVEIRYNLKKKPYFNRFCGRGGMEMNLSRLRYYKQEKGYSMAKLSELSGVPLGDTSEDFQRGDKVAQVVYSGSTGSGASSG